MAFEINGIGFEQENNDFEYQRIGNEEDEDFQRPLREIYSSSYRTFR